MKSNRKSVIVLPAPLVSSCKEASDTRGSSGVLPPARPQCTAGGRRDRTAAPLTGSPPRRSPDTPRTPCSVACQPATGTNRDAAPPSSGMAPPQHCRRNHMTQKQMSPHAHCQRDKSGFGSEAGSADVLYWPGSGLVLFYPGPAL